jgi:hypothetical protein
MHRDEYRRAAQTLSCVQFGSDAVVIGLEDRMATRVSVGLANVLVTWNRGRLTDRRDRGGRMRWAIAVDRQTRIGLNDQPGIERVGQLLGECRRPDVPSDVAIQIDWTQAQSTQGSRQQFSPMVASEEIRRASVRTDDPEWRRLIRAEYSLAFHVSRDPML